MKAPAVALLAVPRLAVALLVLFLAVDFFAAGLRAVVFFAPERLALGRFEAAFFAVPGLLRAGAHGTMSK